MFLKAYNELRMKFSLVYEVLTNGCVLARTGSTFIDVFLALKARKPHGTITAGKEKSLILICGSEKKKKKIHLFEWKQNPYSFNDSNYIVYGVIEC